MASLEDQHIKARLSNTARLTGYYELQLSRIEPNLLYRIVEALREGRVVFGCEQQMSSTDQQADINKLIGAIRRNHIRRLEGIIRPKMDDLQVSDSDLEILKNVAIVRTKEAEYEKGYLENYEVRLL